MPNQALQKKARLNQTSKSFERSTGQIPAASEKSKSEKNPSMHKQTWPLESQEPLMNNRPVPSQSLHQRIDQKQVYS